MYLCRIHKRTLVLRRRWLTRADGRTRMRLWSWYECPVIGCRTVKADKWGKR